MLCAVWTFRPLSLNLFIVQSTWFNLFHCLVQHWKLYSELLLFRSAKTHYYLSTFFPQRFSVHTFVYAYFVIITLTEAHMQTVHGVFHVHALYARLISFGMSLHSCANKLQPCQHNICTFACSISNAVYVFCSTILFNILWDMFITPWNKVYRSHFFALYRRETCLLRYANFVNQIETEWHVFSESARKETTRIPPFPFLLLKIIEL